MAIIHRYIEELELLENNKLFCGQRINNQNRILLIGTFNPKAESCLKLNNATWFYGRLQNKLWKYLPSALTGVSLHPSDFPNVSTNTWQEYCINNQIVIIDLIKRIEVEGVLPDFGDNEVESKISDDLTNTDYFNIESAFRGVTFEKVIYSLLWSDRRITKLKRIRDIINNDLLVNGCIQSLNQVKYCKTPSRNDSFESWNEAINEN